MDDTENMRILRDMAMGRDVSAGDRVMAANWAVREIEKMTACEEQEKPEGVELTDAEYRRGFTDGYNQRDAEVRGALV